MTMTTEQRMYSKIIDYLRDRTGTTHWDFRTLNQAHPQLCAKLMDLLVAQWGSDLQLDRDALMRRYVPRSIYQGREMMFWERRCKLQDEPYSGGWDWSCWD